MKIYAVINKHNQKFEGFSCNLRNLPKKERKKYIRLGRPIQYDDRNRLSF